VSNRGRIDSDSDGEEEIGYRNLERLSQAHKIWREASQVTLPLASLLVSVGFIHLVSCYKG
jgi:hypothetical protein